MYSIAAIPRGHHPHHIPVKSSTTTLRVANFEIKVKGMLQEPKVAPLRSLFTLLMLNVKLVISVVLFTGNSISHVEVSYFLNASLKV